MSTTYPDTEHLLGQQIRPYLHDYPDACATLERYSVSKEISNGSRYNGTNVPGVLPKFKFFKDEFKSLTGQRGNKTHFYPGKYELRFGNEKESKKNELTEEKVAVGEAFEQPQLTLSAGQMHGYQQVEKGTVRDEKFELDLGTKILRNAEEQAGLYASGLRRVDRRTLLKVADVKIEPNNNNLYYNLVNKETGDE